MKQIGLSTVLFCLIFGILGFILGKMSGPCCHPHHPHHAHADQCCAKDKKGGSDKMCKTVTMGSVEDDQAMVEEIMIEFENSDFVGDTTILIPGGKVDISKTNNGEMNVSVNLEKEMESETRTKEGATEVRKEKRIMIMESDSDQ